MWFNFSNKFWGALAAIIRHQLIQINRILTLRVVSHNQIWQACLVKPVSDCPSLRE